MRTAVAGLACAIVVLSAAPAAYAQSTRRPDLNLYGRGLRDPQQSLVVTSNLGATFFDRLSFFEPIDDAPSSPDRGWGSFASAALVYNLQLANVSIDGTFGGFATYYPSQDPPLRTQLLPGAGARAAWSWALSDKTQADLRVGISLSPAYTAVAFPGLGFGGDVPAGGDPNTAFLPSDAAFVDGLYLRAGPSASIRHTLSRRWSASAGYSYERNRALGIDPEDGLLLSAWSQSAHAALHFAVTRHLSVRGGYRFEESRFDDEQEPYRVHGLDLGVDYGRGIVLQLARRTSLALNGGASAHVDRAGQRRFNVVGSAQFTHDFQRTWTLGAGYFRGIDSSQLLFREPVLTDRAIVSLNGLLTRRLGAHASASVDSSVQAFSESGGRSVRGMANAGLQAALGRHFALGIDYVYYQYRFASSVTLPSGLPPTSASQAVYASLSTSVPIFQRGGRNAAR